MLSARDSRNRYDGDDLRGSLPRLSKAHLEKAQKDEEELCHHVSRAPGTDLDNSGFGTERLKAVDSRVVERLGEVLERLQYGYPSAYRFLPEGKGRRGPKIGPLGGTGLSSSVVEPYAMRIVAEVSMIIRRSFAKHGKELSSHRVSCLLQHRITRLLTYYGAGEPKKQFEYWRNHLRSIVLPFFREARVPFREIDTMLEKFNVAAAKRFEKDIQEAMGPFSFPGPTALRDAERFSHAERLAKWAVPLPGGREGQKIALLAQQYCQAWNKSDGKPVELPDEKLVKMLLSDSALHPFEEPRNLVSDGRRLFELVRAYLIAKEKPQLVSYLELRAEGYSCPEAADQMGLGARERHRIHESFGHYARAVAFDKEWREFHELLGVPFSERLGLTEREWRELVESLEVDDRRLLENIMREGEDCSDERLARLTQTNRKRPNPKYVATGRRRILKAAAELRRRR